MVGAPNQGAPDGERREESGIPRQGASGTGLPAGWGPRPVPAGGRPLPWRQEWQLLRLKFVLWAHSLGSLHRASKLSVVVIGGFLAAYLVFTGWLFQKAIRFADHFLGIGSVLIDRMFFMLFAFLGGMLVLSSLLLFSTAAFRTRETAWIQTLPLESARLFRWKCWETGIVAAWASLFLVAPLLFTYGRVNSLAWWVFPLSLLMMLPFLLLMTQVGCLLGLLLARPLQSPWFRRCLATIAVIGVILIVARTRPRDADRWTTGSLLPLVDYLLRQTEVFHQPWLPSTWAGRAVLGMGEGLASKAFFYVGLLVVTLLALENLLWWSAEWGYRRIWLDVQGCRSARPRGRVGRWDFARWAGGLLMVLPIRRGIRSLLWKDVVTFWRDPAQWSQAVLFFGMLGFYIFNLRHIRTQLDQVFWACLVGHLNLVSVGMILAAMQTRFVFPQFALEGRRIWILGLAPVPLDRLIWGKFWLSGTAGAVITFVLMWFSSRFLGAGTGLVISTTATGVVMSYALTGLAVGLGVLHPTMGSAGHFRGEDEDPARLVSGFGGTFCLVASMVYVIGVGAVEGYGMFRILRRGGIAADPWTGLLLLLWVGGSSWLVGWLPMRLARGRLVRLES